MSDKLIPDSDHVGRLVKGAAIGESGAVSGVAFRLRIRDGKLEEYISVNWLEKIASGRPQQLEFLRRTYREKGFTVRSTYRIGVLNVGELKAKSAPATVGRDTVSVRHLPEQNDPSHSGIFGLREDDRILEELLAQSVQSLEPAAS
jgi:hypothetical protein